MKRQGEEYNRGFLETVREYNEEREMRDSKMKVIVRVNK